MDVGYGPEPLSACVMVLSHSRKPAVVWSPDKTLLSWLSCHNRAYSQAMGFQASVETSRIETLATCGWLREHATVLIQGPLGVGKTHLAIGLGVKAVENGFSVAFSRFDDLLHAMKQDAELPPQTLRRNKYNTVRLLVVDEVGFQPMSRQEAGLFSCLVSYRYQRGSTLITTHKALQDWPEVLTGDEAMAAALLDRLLHHCQVLNIRGRSVRLRDLERMLK